ncbi:hypothetical protein RSOL_445440 [Rhizoctonia solani AG-3 Rhs1AP]|uniref:Uncharacterized protein n=1 Tax=Rhizoctonia solani AG-3 Rhs1AP TaxID=1086054 RepID=X8JQW4_9AGAM|nr:hypothetical protein RSOL_445440 [Rhizoctonia solani AG-3 Rhs1AP]
MQTQGNTRASLLANLRTGGVRSVSGVPHSAGPTATSFNIPRFSHYEDDEEMIGQMQHLAFNSNAAMGPRAMINGPMTGGIGGPNQFQQQQMMMQMMLQQQHGMGLSAEQQALQLQLQNEILILQAKQQQQQQQFQAQILAQAQAQQAQLQAQIQAAQAAQQAQSGLNTRLNPVINRRVSAANAVPSTAGPLQTSFNLATAPAPRRTMSIDQDTAPMTAAIGGRFGSRAPSLPVTALNPNAAAFSFGPRVGSPTKENYEAQAQSVSGSPPNGTTVISGGTSLGASASAPTASRAQSDPSWRRSSQSSSPESQAQRLSPPMRDQSPVSRARPQPLRFNSALSTTVEAPLSVPSSPEPDIVATSTDGVQTILIDNGHSTGSRSPSSTSPTTPVGGESMPAREEASKRLYEGLGMGRPLPASQSQLSSAMGSNASLTSLSGASTPARAVSQAMRQPRGPPTEVSELGPRNFASRVRSKAIGGLEAMMLARNRRQGLDVEAF